MFEAIPELDDDEFFMKLMNKPHKLRISNIGDLRESNNGKGHYFYIDFVLVEMNFFSCLKPKESQKNVPRPSAQTTSDTLIERPL